MVQFHYVVQVSVFIIAGQCQLKYQSNVRFLVLHDRCKLVLMHHVDDGMDIEKYDRQIFRLEEAMSTAKRLLAIIRGDRKLLVTFSGVLIDGICLVSIIITACLWFLI